MNQFDSQFPSIWALVSFPNNYGGVRFAGCQVDDSQCLFHLKALAQNNQTPIGPDNAGKRLFAAGCCGIRFLPLEGYRYPRVQADSTALSLHFRRGRNCRLRLHALPPIPRKPYPSAMSRWTNGRERGGRASMVRRDSQNLAARGTRVSPQLTHGQPVRSDQLTSFFDYDSLTSCFMAQSGKTGARRSRGPPAFMAWA
jgi:hypothetical protein